MHMFDLCYEGISYWQLVRHTIIRSIPVNGAQITDINNHYSYFRMLSGTVHNALLQLLLPKEKCDVLIIRPHVNYPPEKGGKDREFDYSGTEKIYKVSNIFALGEYSDKNVNKYEDFSIPELKVTAWKVKRKLFGGRKLPKEDREKIENFIHEVNREYKANITYEDVERRVFYSIFVFRTYLKHIVDVLKKKMPKIILCSTYYDDHIYPLAYAAKLSGIPLVEVQHGLTYAHEAYWYEDITDEGKYLPDYFFMYGDWWKDNIKMPAGVKIRVVGYPFLEDQIDLSHERGERIVISVISSPFSGKQLSRFVMDNIGLIKEYDIKVIYKLHPMEAQVWHREYPWLERNDNIEIIDDGTSVFKCLNESDIVIGIDSTVLYEATAYSKLKILVYRDGPYEVVRPLVESGRAKFIDNFMDVLSSLNESQGIEDSKKYFTPNAKQRTISTIKSIINA